MGVRFNSTSDSLSRTANLPNIANFTAMGWFKIITDRNAYSTFISFGNTSAPYYQIETNTDGVTLTTWNGSSTYTGSILTIGEWYHIAIVVNGTSTDNFKAYLNGSLDITNDGNASIIASKMAIGNSPDSEYLNGIVECIKVWNNTALTENEIKQEMYLRLPERSTNLRFWLPLDENDSNTSARDFSGNGRNFTVNGTLEQEDGSPIITTSMAVF